MTIETYETWTTRDDPALARRLEAEHARADRIAERVVRAVAAYYTLSPDTLLAKDRTREVTEARQVAMYLMRLGIRWATVARAEGGALRIMAGPFPFERIAHHLRRDHSTVLYGWRTVDRKRREDHTIAYIVETIAAELRRPRRTA